MTTKSQSKTYRAASALKSGVMLGSTAIFSAVNTLTPHMAGAVDIMMVEQPDGSLLSSPFYVRFGKYTPLRSKDKRVEVLVNGVDAGMQMHLGTYGQAYFAAETTEIVSDNEEEALLAGMMSPASGYSSGDEGPPYASTEILTEVQKQVEVLKNGVSGIGEPEAGTGEPVRQLEDELIAANGVLPTNVAAQSTISSTIVTETHVENAVVSTVAICPSENVLGGSGTRVGELLVEEAAAMPLALSLSGPASPSKTGSCVRTEDDCQEAGALPGIVSAEVDVGSTEGDDDDESSSGGASTDGAEEGSEASTPQGHAKVKRHRKRGVVMNHLRNLGLQAHHDAHRKMGPSEIESTVQDHKSQKKDPSSLVEVVEHALNRNISLNSAGMASVDMDDGGPVAGPAHSPGHKSRFTDPSPSQGGPPEPTHQQFGFEVRPRVMGGQREVSLENGRASSSPALLLNDGRNTAGTEQVSPQGIPPGSLCTKRKFREDSRQLGALHVSKAEPELSPRPDNWVTLTVTSCGPGDPSGRLVMVDLVTGEDQKGAVANIRDGVPSSPNPILEAANGEAPREGVETPPMRAHSYPEGTSSFFPYTANSQDGEDGLAGASPPSGDKAKNLETFYSIREPRRNSSPGELDVGVSPRISAAPSPKGENRRDTTPSDTGDFETPAAVSPRSPGLLSVSLRQEHKGPEPQEEGSKPTATAVAPPSEDGTALNAVVSSAPVSPAVTPPIPVPAGSQAGHGSMETLRLPPSRTPAAASLGWASFDLSLCGQLIQADMPSSSAQLLFDSHRITEEDFKARGAQLVMSPDLVVRVGDVLYPWAVAGPMLLGQLAFGGTWDQYGGERGLQFKVDELAQERASPPRKVPTSTWRLWPFSRRERPTSKDSSTPLGASPGDMRSVSEPTIAHARDSSAASVMDMVGAASPPPAVFSPLGQSPPVSSLPPGASPIRRKKKHIVITRKTLTPSADQLKALRSQCQLSYGQNTVVFRVGGYSELPAYVYLLKWNCRLIISDVDGTITRSDLLGHVLPAMGVDWSHPGITELFSNIVRNGYQIMFLSSRAIAQANITRDYLHSLVQGGYKMPVGPVIISPHGLLPSLYREMILRRPHEFKIACLQDIRSLFPEDWNPFYAGFGNRDTDIISYREVGVPLGRIFTINPKGEIRKASSAVQSSTWASLSSINLLVEEMFPDTNATIADEDQKGIREEYNDLQYWRSNTFLSDIDLEDV